MITITRPTLSEAWIDTLGAVLGAGGRGVNVITSWHADNEVVEVRAVLDEFIATRPTPSKAWQRWPVETVANTIFAADLYEEALGTDALANFAELYLEGFEIAKPASPGGEYCHRLVAWPGPDGEPINQLAEVAAKLRRYADSNDRSYRYSSNYEIAVENPVLDLRTQLPGRNRDPYGFPCLSHISLTVVDGVVHLTALYRNQHLIRKAYGNYLGLGRLGQALCHHAGLELGTVTVIATHADAEVGSARGFGMGALQELHSSAIAALPSNSIRGLANTASGLATGTATALKSLTEGDITVTGVDAVSVAEFAADFGGDRHVLETVFNDGELNECDNDNERLAARFAAKEAALKALGTGIRGLDMLDIGVCTDARGRPFLQLSDAAKSQAKEGGLHSFECSLTHEEGFAIAVVVAMKSPATTHQL